MRRSICRMTLSRHAESILLPAHVSLRVLGAVRMSPDVVDLYLELDVVAGFVEPHDLRLLGSGDDVPDEFECVAMASGGAGINAVLVYMRGKA